MGWTNQAVILFVLIEPKSGFSGIFVYSPGFAAGDLTASIAAVTGQDPKGNHYLPQIAAYAGTNAVQLNGEGLQWFAGSEEAGWAGQAALVILQPSIPTMLSLRIGGPFPEGVVAIVGPSADTTGATDAAAINLALTLGISEVRLLPGQYYLNSTISMSVGQYVRGAGAAGENATIINWVGTGDCFWQTFDGTYDGTTTIGGGIRELTIDGTSAGAGSCGIHAGDIASLTYDRTLVRNFDGAGSIGYHFDNHYNFTERLGGRIEAINCTSGVVFDVTSNTGPSPDSSTPSFARILLDVFISLGAVTHEGVVVRNGANLYHGRLGIRGNFTGGPSGTPGAALTITGQVPAGHAGAGNDSQLVGSQLDIGAESGAGTVLPQTLSFGAAGNIISQCYGSMQFIGAGWTPSNNSGNVQFLGPVSGDTTLPHTTSYNT